MPISNKYSDESKYLLFQGDCNTCLKWIPDETIDVVITSPPYFMGKEYDRSSRIEDFVEAHKAVLPEILRVTKPGGSVCWQVGYHIRNGVTVPLDYLVYNVFAEAEDLRLRNRIIWTFGHGKHAQNKFSGRHETVLWFTKGDDYEFDLDSVRVPQKYPGKKSYSGKKKGEYSGNPLGKNPTDIWSIPNVKAKHVEKTSHPCQFPVALAQRLIRALCPSGGRVLDPYAGVGSTGVAALLESRTFVGIEIEREYIDIAEERCEAALDGTIRYRLDTPVFIPHNGMAVARKPAHFK